MYFPRIRDMREDADLTQAQIADMLGIAQTVYSRYERGERELPMHLFIRLSQHYAMSLDYMVGLSDQPKPTK